MPGFPDRYFGRDTRLYHPRCDSWFAATHGGQLLTFDRNGARDLYEPSS
jgi:hypothetical protein